MSVSVVSEAALSAALFDVGLLFVPLLAHFVFTSVVVVLATRFRVRYPLAVIAGVVIHAIYNLIVAGGLR